MQKHECGFILRFTHKWSEKAVKLCLLFRSYEHMYIIMYVCVCVCR